MDEKTRALAEMKAAMEHLREAWIECNDAFSNIYIECNDYIIGSRENEDEYPFHMSFDELMTVNWIDGCIERMEADLNGRNES